MFRGRDNNIAFRVSIQENIQPGTKIAKVLHNSTSRFCNLYLLPLFEHGTSPPPGAEGQQPSGTWFCHKCERDYLLLWGTNLELTINFMITNNISP